MKNTINKKLEAQVVALRKTGLKFELIGSILGFSRQRAHSIYKRYKINMKNPIVKPANINRLPLSEVEKKNGKVINDIMFVIDTNEKVPLIDTFENGEKGIYKPIKRNYK